MKFVYVEGVIIIFFFLSRKSEAWIARSTLLVLFWGKKVSFLFHSCFILPFISDCLCVSQTVFEFWPLYNTTTSAHIVEKTTTSALDCAAIENAVESSLTRAQIQTSSTTTKSRVNMYNIGAVLFFTNFAFCIFFFRNVMTGYKQ